MPQSDGKFVGISSSITWEEEASLVAAGTPESAIVELSYRRTEVGRPAATDDDVKAAAGLQRTANRAAVNVLENIILNL